MKGYRRYDEVKGMRSKANNRASLKVSAGARQKMVARMPCAGPKTVTSRGNVINDIGMRPQ